MDLLTLNLNQLAVETFETGAPDAALLPTQKPGMKTYEPGCTTPELCPLDNTTVAVAA
jgi:hypothetical protein